MSEPDTHPFRSALIDLLNAHGLQNDSGTPQHILADYLIGALAVFGIAVGDRDEWWETRCDEPATDDAERRHREGSQP